MHREQDRREHRRRQPGVLAREQAYEQNDRKMADELSQKIDALEETLGPEYVALIDGLQDIDPEKDKLGAEIMSIFTSLDSCVRDKSRKPGGASSYTGC